jgi:hypothetical protein
MTDVTEHWANGMPRGDMIDEIDSLRLRLAQANGHITELELEVIELEGELAEAAIAEDVFDWIADVRRGLLTLEELYERALP